MSEKQRKDKCNIICDAQNCVFNRSESRRCTANEIRVGTAHASTSAETICSTFDCGDRG